MPQGRRKTPFSVKQKKIQLQNKRKKKAGLLGTDDAPEEERVQKINRQPQGDGRSRANRYALQFFSETKEEIQKRKELARQAIVPVPEEQLEIDIDDYFLPELDFPKRPPWDYTMSKEELDARENLYFTEYVSTLKKNSNWDERISYFELNLETWRQLWRVLEMSDVILFIVDIRFPALMFPPSLYTYIVDVGKEMILVLNKVDLAPAELVVAWKYYFKSKFPSIHVVTFTSYPSCNLHGNLGSTSTMRNQKRRGRMRMAVEGSEMLQETCHQIVNDQVDLSSWKKKINEEKLIEYDDVKVEETIETKAVDTSYHEHVKFCDGVLTIGCVGQPNAGKSSVINAIMGKKVVSVSKTPGHTKHFQTIFITPTVKLCDCPGLVFPSKVPKVLQVLMGSFPIAQVSEPYTTVRYLAERLDLVKILRIQYPDADVEWSAMDICDGWARLRGFFTARSVRPDTSRAANHLLRIALEGKICLCLRPAGYSKKKDMWKKHPEIQEVLRIQAEWKSDESSNREDSDVDSEEDSVEVIPSSNKFAALADDD